MKNVLHGAMGSEFFLPTRGKGDRLWRWMRGFPAKPYLFSRAPKKIIAAFLCAALLLTAAGCSRGSPGEVSTAQTTQEEEKSQFPMTLDNGNVTVEELFGADGLFTEKGNLDEVKNVTALRVKNNSTQMLEYGKISYRVNGIERADFEISALPAGESAIVMESFAREYSPEDDYLIDEESMVFAYCDASVESESIKVKTDGSNITIKNKTEKNITATVVYKYYKDGMYYGGIAFRGKFEDIIPGGSVTKKSDRFNENCKIVNVVVE